MEFNSIVLLIMWIISTWRDVVLEQDMEEGIDTSNLVIYKVDTVGCTVLNDEGFEILTPLYLCFHTMNIPKEGFIT